jgi:hypothetical protein
VQQLLLPAVLAPQTLPSPLPLLQLLQLLLLLLLQSLLLQAPLMPSHLIEVACYPSPPSLRWLLLLD